MRWGNIEYLSLLLVTPILVVFYHVAWVAKRNALNRFGNAALVNKLTMSVDRSKQKIKIVLVILGFIFLVLAIARPQYGQTHQPVHRQGVDIIIALDVSRSMRAADMQPNRLERAKYEIRQLIEQLDGDRIGLVVFEGEAQMQCPLTLDYGAVLLFLREAEPGMLPTPGTNIEAAILAATRGFVQEEQQHKVLILVTDGEQTLGGNAVEAAKEAAQKGIRIYCIGIGSEEGAPIQYRDEQGQLVTHRDRTGRAVVSRIDTDLLSRVALATGGRFHQSGTASIGLDRILEDIREQETKMIEGSFYIQYDERFQIPLFVALLLLLFEQLLTDRRKKIASQEESV